MSGSAVRTPIAVVGMSCRLPGAEGLDEYWTLLTESRDAVVEFPPHRLNRDLYYDGRKGQRGKTYSTIGGLVTERPPRVGDESYDVCHRHFADVALEACQHSGIEPAELASRQVGVFVGHSGGSGEFSDIGLGTMAAQAYDPLRSVPALQDMAQDRREGIITQAVERLRRNRRKRTPDGGPKTEARWAAELVARTLDLKGPNLVVDAACSSSLVALALGALALEREEIDVAIVGGASYAQANSLILFSQAQSCSARGSRPFDEEADGLVGSEGYVAVVLKTEARARRDGDSILAVIRGLGLSTDGRGRHLWAPQKEGQTAAIERAYGSEIDPASVQYIEAHATSTQVGDATEIESMVEFFQPHLDGQKIPIGSVKSNIGHTLETAGLASLIKVILAMQHRTIPPTINISKLNDTIDWDSIPFSVARSIEPWARPEGNVRRGAVSAFGIGGLNVHLVVEEPRREAPRDAYLPAPSREPIAIVGRGLIVPGAHDLDAFRSFLKEGISALIEAPESRWPGHIGVDAEGGPWSSPTCLGGFVTDYEYDYVAHRVPPKQVAAANPLQFMLLDATEQALNEAGVVDRKHTSVVVGTVFGGEFANQLLLGMRFPEVRRNLEDVLRSEGLADEQCISIADTFERLFIQAHPATLDETGSFTSSTLASRITKAFDLQGGALAMEAGESSSLVALGTACALLRGNVCSAVVCAGAQRGLDLPSYEAMRLKGGFTQPEFFPGEGVGALVLKRLQDARRDGNAVFGILLGDACSYGADGAGAATAMSARRALEAAGLEQGQVATVEPGGGTAEVCEAQASGLSTIYSTTSKREPSLASMMGHLGAAEGLVSIIRATLEPGEGLESHHAVSESGLACHVLLGPPPPARVEGNLGLRIRLGAPTRAELFEKLLYASAPSDEPFADDDRFRLAIVASQAADMRSRLGLAESRFGREDPRGLLGEQGIFFGEVPRTRPRIAFVFAGQGSQYPGMLKELVENSAAAGRAMRDADRQLKAAGLGSFSELAWGESSRLDHDPVTTQVAVLVADVIMYAATTECGIEPDCVCGHSFGEIAAMVAARVLTLEQAVRVTIARARALSEADPEGGLLSVRASLDVVRELIGSQPLDLHVTHHNAPHQTVVGGRTGDLSEFAERLTAEGFKCQPLRVPGALHSPMVKAAQEPFRQALTREKLCPPTKLFYSNVSRDQISRSDDFVTNLVDQLVEPLDYPALIDRLLAEGVGALVEVGPGQVLTRLHRQIVGEDIVCTGTDHARRSAWEQLERARVALECVGAVPDRGGMPIFAPAVPRQIAEFDATSVRRQRRRSESAAAQSDRSAHPEPEPGSDSTLARLPLDYVVDLTGYPRDAISLDWDLEADLGIDSIKRMQLIGELAEVLGLETAAEAQTTLTGLHTLRELLDYLENSETAGDGTPSAPNAEDRAL